MFQRFVHLHEISYCAGKLQFYQLWRNFCNWPVAGSQHIYPMHTYIHTYILYIYLHICTCAYSLLWSNDSRFCLVVQYNSYLLLTVFIRRSLPFVFFLSHYLTYKRAFLRNFNFCGIAWFLFTFICACPGSVTVLLGADNAAYEQRVMCGKTRHQVHSCVCVSLWGLALSTHCPLYRKFVCDLFVYLFKLLNLH